ncbi:MAG TPA: HD domain-containing protein [Candidatus Kapabacteria bacterium]|nr:HD domain-containing protein [Candidatus Kapabacteria bacterium]
MLQQSNQPGYNRTFLSKSEIRDRLMPIVGAVELNRIICAYEMAENVHQFQVRNDGTPYFWHVTRVTRILLEELDIHEPDVLVAGLLHDTLEDSDILNSEVLEYNFGPFVSYLVETLTKEVRVDDGPLREQIDREYVERLKNSPEDCRVIKLADRLDNFRCLQFNLKRNPYKYVKETSEHYLPMAENSNNLHMLYLLKELKNERNKFFG